MGVFETGDKTRGSDDGEAGSGVTDGGDIRGVQLGGGYKHAVGVYGCP